MRRGTLALSWGPWGGFYVHPHRVCLGFVAITYVRVEIDDLMGGNVGRDDLLSACKTLRASVEADQLAADFPSKADAALFAAIDKAEAAKGDQ